MTSDVRAPLQTLIKKLHDLFVQDGLWREFYYRSESTETLEEILCAECDTVKGSPHQARCKVGRFESLLSALIAEGPSQQEKEQGDTRVDHSQYPNNPLATAASNKGGPTMITIRQSPTADTRTCDYAKVSRDMLLASSHQHIRDVREAHQFFSRKIAEAILAHDTDKITDIDGFHRDFVTGFQQTTWWDAHRKLNRHHLTQDDGIPADVNLIDVLDFIADCVMAGMARSGSVYPLKLSPELLERAFQNTVTLLKSQVVVDSATPRSAPATAQPYGFTYALVCQGCGEVCADAHCVKCEAAAPATAEEPKT